MMRRILTLVSLLMLLAPASAFAQSYTLSPPPFLLAQTNSGAIINAACVWTYAAGTLTAAATYSDNAGTPNTNPIRSDSAGRFTAYLLTGTSYKFVFESACTPPAHGTVLRTQDNIAATPASAANVDLTGGAGETISAGQCVYLSDGSGGKTQGQWYKCDSTNTYSSVTPQVGIAPSAIASGTSGTIRIVGTVTGLSSLTVGGGYYIGTSGAISLTSPTNARFVGQADTATSLVVLAPQLQKLVSPTINTSIFSSLITACGFRATLTSGTAVTTADVTGAVSVFLTPFSSSSATPGVCSFYDGAATWSSIRSAEITVALGTLTSSLPYDIFCFNNSGVMACDAPLAWTNTTTRATALALQDGVLVKTGTTTRRYMGSFFTTSTTTTEDSVLKRDLFSYYNRVPRELQRFESTASWTYNTSTVRQANASASNQVEVMQGVAESAIDLVLSVNLASTGGTGSASVGIGEDSTTTYVRGMANPLINAATMFFVRLNKTVAVGRHVYSWNEWGGALAGTPTFYGVTAGAGSTITQGLEGLTWQ